MDELLTPCVIEASPENVTVPPKVESALLVTADLPAGALAYNLMVEEIAVPTRRSTCMWKTENIMSAQNKMYAYY